jgi:hypothetical protein
MHLFKSDNKDREAYSEKIPNLFFNLLSKIRKKEGPCRNRGRLPKLTAYEKIEN